MIRTLIMGGVPVLIYLPGAVDLIQTRGGEPCLAPCLMLFTAPIEKTFALAKSAAGLAGEAVLVILLLIWVINTLQILRCRGVGNST